MKKILSAIILIAAAAFSLNAQQNLRTAYFLDGYTYGYKMNPAFQGERGFLAVPVFGKLSMGVESDLGLSTFLYPSSDGTLMTFLHPEVSDSDFLAKMKGNKMMTMNADMPFFALGFRTGKAYHTLDISARVDGGANLTKDLFHFMKIGSSDGKDTWDISDFGARAEARMELAYGYSRHFGENVSVGARVKLLMGMARVNVAMDQMNLKMNGDEWAVAAKGSAEFAGIIDVKTKENNVLDWNTIGLKDGYGQNGPSIGLAVDLGVSVDLLDDYLTLSASVLDLGSIRWKDVVTASTPSTVWSFTGFDNVSFDGEDSGMSDQFSGLADDLSDAMNFIKDSGVSESKSALSATTHLGLEARMPFYDRLSVGVLGTHRFAGAYSWTEGRFSINWALLRFFALSGSYAISDFGNSLGGAVNIHLPGVTLFAGLDSFLPLMNVTPDFIPIDSWNTNLSVGLNIAFGKYHGRYPKSK